MFINPYDKERISRQFPAAMFRPLEDGEEFEAGKTYFCGYWHQVFTVLAVTHDSPIWGVTYTCRWEDGTTTTHSTKPELKRDFEIVKNR